MTRARPSGPIAIIVADDVEYGSLAAAVFKESGFRPIVSDAAETAYGMMLMFGEDVAFLFADMTLPGVMDGIDLARVVGYTWPGTRVVLTSGAIPRQPLPVAAGFVPKPWRAVDLILEAERAAARRRAA